MNIHELGKVLLERNIPCDLYNLDGIGRDDERFCLEVVGDQWTVFFAERGIRTTEKKFSNEDDACRYLLEQLIDA